MPRARKPQKSRGGGQRDRSHLTAQLTDVRQADGSKKKEIRYFNLNGSPENTGKGKALRGATSSLVETPEEQEPLKESINNLLKSMGVSGVQGEGEVEKAFSLLKQTGREVHVYEETYEEEYGEEYGETPKEPVDRNGYKVHAHNDDVLPEDAANYDGKSFHLLDNSESELPLESNVVHEFAHYLVSSPERRQLRNFGLGYGPDESRYLQREGQVLGEQEAAHEEELASALGIAIEYANDFDWLTPVSVHRWEAQTCPTHTPRGVLKEDLYDFSSQSDEYHDPSESRLDCPTCYPKFNQRLDEAMQRARKWGLQ